MCRTCWSGRPTARSSALAITRSWLRCRATPWRAAATRTPADSDSERSRAIHSPGAVVVQWGAMRIIAPISSLTVLAATVALADPYGPPYAVTDMAPLCAHSLAPFSPPVQAAPSPAQLPGPPRRGRGRREHRRQAFRPDQNGPRVQGPEPRRSGAVDRRHQVGGRAGVGHDPGAVSGQAQ